MRLIVHHAEGNTTEGTLADINDPTGRLFFEQGTPVTVTPAARRAGGGHGNVYEVRIGEDVFLATREGATDEAMPVRIYHTLPLQ